MNKEKLISVILSTFNSEKTLEDSVKSILDQSYKNIELLIMDDCSEDSTSKILKKIKKNHKNVKLFKNETNQGLTKSLNKLISESSGELIARQDSDDISHPERISIQALEIEKNKLDFCSSRAIIKGSNRKIPGFSFFLPQKFTIKYKNPFIHGTLLIKKDVLHAVGNYDENFYYAQDYKLMSDLLNQNFKYSLINKPLYELNTKNNISTKKLQEQNYYAECVRKKIIPKL